MILDSNIWVAYLNTDDSQHTKASKVFSTINEPIIITEYLILEISTILSIRANKKIADQFIDLVLNNEDVKVILSEEIFFHKTIQQFLVAKNNHLSFVDISLTILAQNHQVLTFDEKLKKAIK